MGRKMRRCEWATEVIFLILAVVLLVTTRQSLSIAKEDDSWANDSMAPVEDKGRLYRFEAFSTIREYLDWAAKYPELAPKD
jgi:hypothetical protein